MKTTEVNKNLIGRRCECIFTGMMVTGVIEDIEENKYSVNVKVHFDKPQQWGDDLYTEDWAWGRKTDEFGTLHHLRLLADEPDFQTMTVVFGEPISQIDRSVFEDVSTWGVSSLQGWINSYESYITDFFNLLIKADIAIFDYTVPSINLLLLDQFHVVLPRFLLFRILVSVKILNRYGSITVRSCLRAAIELLLFYYLTIQGKIPSIFHNL